LCLGSPISEEDFDVEQGSAPADDAERLAGGGFDAFALGAHADVSHGAGNVAMWRDGVGRKMRR
jgi:hypothetical protein